MDIMAEDAVRRSSCPVKCDGGVSYPPCSIVQSDDLAYLCGAVLGVSGLALRARLLHYLERPTCIRFCFVSSSIYDCIYIIYLHK